MSNEQKSAPLSKAEYTTLLSSIRRLGYLPLKEDAIKKGLSGFLDKGASVSDILYSTGWALIKDPCGLWPSIAFRNALCGFKESQDLQPLIARSRENPVALLAISLSCSEMIDAKTRRIIENAAKDDGFAHLRLPTSYKAGAGNYFRSAQLVASYLGPGNQMPWNQADREEIKKAIMIGVVGHFNWYAHRREKFDKGLDEPSDDLIYSRAYALDREHAFRNSVHIGWRVMPDLAMRLSIDVPRDKNEFRPRLAKVCDMLSGLVAQGHDISVKFTSWLSEYRGSHTGLRYCLYIPTCALGKTMAAYKEAGLADGGFLPLQNGYRANAFLLSGNALLRSTGEENVSSLAQGDGAFEALNRNGIDHRYIGTGETSTFKNSMTLEDGSVLDLWTRV